MRVKKREIILNKMYVGGYLSDGGNIGHEIINLFKADDGNHYIYLNPTGRIDASHYDNEITVLLVRPYAKHTYAVLGKAEGIQILDSCKSGQQTSEISYGGVNLREIFSDNLYHGDTDTVSTLATFQAERVLTPSKPLYIADSEDAAKGNGDIYYIKTEHGFGKMALRQFFTADKTPSAFNDLQSIIDAQGLWNSESHTDDVAESDSPDLHFNFLKIIGQEDHELAFSNMFAYFFRKKPEVFADFAETILGVALQPDFSVAREEKNIDLLISDEKNVIVIENKIKSGINGVDRYADLRSGEQKSQLQKYHDYVTTEDKFVGKKHFFFIFTPNYNRVALEDYVCGDKYKPVSYKTIYNFFCEKKEQFSDVPYFEEFTNSMFKHTNEYDNELELEMHRRFFDAIRKAKR